MSGSVFPKYFDHKEINFWTVRSSPGSAVEPVTPFSADLLNYLADVMFQTQRGLGIRFGEHSDLQTGHGVSGSETFSDNITARTRFEIGTFSGSATTTQSVDFAHTTNGGSTQRFKSDGSELRIFVLCTDATTSSPGRIWIHQILTDGSGYPYAFEMKSEHNMSSSRKFVFFAIQDWG